MSAKIILHRSNRLPVTVWVDEILYYQSIKGEGKTKPYGLVAFRQVSGQSGQVFVKEVRDEITALIESAERRHRWQEANHQRMKGRPTRLPQKCRLKRGYNDR